MLGNVEFASYVENNNISWPPNYVATTVQSNISSPPQLKYDVDITPRYSMPSSTSRNDDSVGSFKWDMGADSGDYYHVKIMKERHACTQ